MNFSIIKKQRGSLHFLPWLIWCTACFFYAYQFFLRVSISGLEIQLVKNFHFSAITLSNVAASFFYAFILMQIPAGILVNRFGARRMLTIASLICAMGCLLFSFETNVLFLEIGRFCMGVGGAFGLIIALALSHNWFSEKQFIFLNGLMMTVGTMGALLGGVPLMLLIGKVSISTIIRIAALISVVIALITWWTVYDSPAHLTQVTVPIKWKQTGQHIVAVIKNKTVWIAALYAGTLFLPLSTFAIVWGTPFFIAEYHVSPELADLSSTITFLGVGFGSVMSAWLANYFNNRVLVMRWGALLAFVLMCIILYVPGVPFYFVLVLLFCLGGLLSCATLAFIIVSKVVDKSNNSIAFSITNIFQTLGGALSLPLIGWLLEEHWSGEMVHNVKIYHMDNYHTALMIIPISICLSIVISLFLREV